MHTGIGVAGAALLIAKPEAHLLLSAFGPVANIALWKALGLAMGKLITDDLTKRADKSAPKL